MAGPVRMKYHIFSHIRLDLLNRKKGYIEKSGGKRRCKQVSPVEKVSWLR
jgi:hypothetical protein